MNDFYMTIPSNTRVHGNTASHFRAVLPHQLELKGRWEVALVEVQYPQSYYNVRKEMRKGETIFENSLAIRRVYTVEERKKLPEDVLGTIYNVPIGEGNYKDVTELCDVINSVAEKEHRFPRLFTTNNRIQGRVYFQKPEGYDSAVLSATLAYMLGFNQRTLTSSQMAEGMPDMRNGIDTMWVYCSIIEEQIVGDTMEQLLRTVAVGGNFGDVVTQIYPIPHYVGVLCKAFSTIEFYIKDDQDRPIPFTYGKTIIKLHFRNAN